MSPETCAAIFFSIAIVTAFSLWLYCRYEGTTTCIKREKPPGTITHKIQHREKPKVVIPKSATPKETLTDYSFSTGGKRRIVLIGDTFQEIIE